MKTKKLVFKSYLLDLIGTKETLKHERNFTFTG